MVLSYKILSIFLFSSLLSRSVFNIDFINNVCLICENKVFLFYYRKINYWSLLGKVKI